ncbi:MAG: DNA gyrase subunit A [Gammaproteobacteria bacterium]
MDFAKDLQPVSLEARMKSAYLDYAMSVIVGRALPDVRDGLKPVHRRTLFAMHEAGNDFNKPYKKSARIVGDVLGKFHPHSGDAVYDALVRMAQDFSMREILVDGQGNFGSVDGDNPAAMRYTEVRMAKIAHTLLADIDRETVDFAPNYDGAEKEPTVLPARFPNLLVNGSSGIAVGMATNIPPHNLGEVVDACLHLLQNPECDADALCKFVPAPDFPTGGLLSGMSGVRAAYFTGRGRVTMRAKTHFESLDRKKTRGGEKAQSGALLSAPEKGGRTAIVIDELPYQVNKASLISRIADLAREKKLDGISDLRDESDRRGIRVVIELRRNENAEVALNRLFKETQMQENFSINMVSLVDGTPQLLGLREMLSHFLRHRREVVVRRATFDLRKARARAHLLEGYAAAIANVDEIVDLIKTSPSPAEAESALKARAWPAATVAAMLSRLSSRDAASPEDADPSRGLRADGYWFSDAQAKAILDLRLARLTAMEREKIAADYAAVVGEIIGHLALLASPEKIDGVIAAELGEMKKNFASPRRSEIAEFDGDDLDLENLIAEEDMMVTFSHRGYVKRQPVSDYQAQRRGGRGRQAAGTREDDFISRLFVASTHDYLLLFTNLGRAYCKKVYELPPASRIARGSPVVGLLKLREDEAVQTVLPLDNFNGARHVIFATAKGVVKKTPLKAFANTRSNGIIAIDLDEGDRLINADLIEAGGTVLLFSNRGKILRFAADGLRGLSRTARGVASMNFRHDEKNGQVVSMLALSEEQAKNHSILIAADNGRGKRTSAAEFEVKGRRGLGVIAMQLKNKNKDAFVIGATLADDKDGLMLITDGGVLVRTNMNQIRKVGRNTQGFSLIRLDPGRRLTGLARIAEEDENGGE